MSTQKMYSTNNIFTKGVTICDLKNYTVREGYVQYRFEPWHYFTIGTNIFHTRKEALEKAELMRLNKIRSLENSLARYKKLKFKLKTTIEG